MKNENDLKRYLNYFKKWEGAGITGIGFLIAFAFCLWLGWGYSYLLYLISFPCLFAGIGFFLYGNIGRASMADIENMIERNAEKVTFKELEEDPHLRKRTPKSFEEKQFQGYAMTDGVMVKKMKSGSLCSSEYDVAKMVVLNDAYYVKMLHFSFVSEDFEIVTHDIPFSLIENIEVERQRFGLTSGKTRYLAKTCHLVFTYDGGKRAMLPANDDIYIDELAEKLKKDAGI